MRIRSALLGLLTACVLLPATPAVALSAAERMEKLIRRYAIDDATVFTPKFRPKGLCYCTGTSPRTVGFLVYAGDPVALVCGIPLMVNPDGEFLVVDYGCDDFAILTR